MLKMAVVITAVVLLFLSNICVSLEAVVPPTPSVIRCEPRSGLKDEMNVIIDVPDACRALFDVSHVLFPSPRFVNEYNRGFNNLSEIRMRQATFAKQLLDKLNGCSKKLATLVCFAYFPFCLPIGNTMKYSHKSLPCKDVLEEITGANSNCSNLLGTTWPEPFNDVDYKYLEYVLRENIWVAENMTMFVEHSQDPSCARGESNSETAPTEPAPTEPAPTLNPCQLDLDDSIAPKSCTSCKIRDSYGSEVIQKNGYTVAVDCTVKNITTAMGRHAFICEVTKGHCDSTSIPVNTEITFVGCMLEDELNCFDADDGVGVVVGGKYFVGGHKHDRALCGDTVYVIHQAGKNKRGAIGPTKSRPFTC